MKTKIFSWEEPYGFSNDELSECRDVICRGGLVAFPTETVYGLGGDALSKEAAKKIYAAKGRPSDNPLILHIADLKELRPLVKRVPPVAEKLMDAFWPGPMTLVFQKSDMVPKETTGGLDTAAIRMPNSKAALAFIRAAGVPIAGPSANTSGRPSPTCAEHVKEDLDGKIDIILDGGSVDIGIESTIIDVTGDIPVILRPGMISQDMLEAEVGIVEMDKGLASDSKEPPKAPGMKYRHYAPKAEMTIIDGKEADVIAYINEHTSNFAPDEVGVLATEETKDKYQSAIVISLGSRRTNRVAKELYRALREFDHAGVKVIYSESFAGESYGVAVMNRLVKAAGHHIIQV